MSPSTCATPTRCSRVGARGRRLPRHGHGLVQDAGDRCGRTSLLPRCRSTRSTGCSATARCSTPNLRQHHRPVHRSDHPGDGGQDAPRTPQPGVGGVQVQARWRGGNPRSCGRSCNALIDEFIEAGEADLVRDFTFEFPTRVISKLLGLPEDDLPWFRKRAVELISYHVKYKRAFEASAALQGLLPRADRAAPVAADRGHHRRSGVGRDRRREAQRRSHLLVPAAAAARRPGDHLPVVGQPAVPVADPSRPVRRGAGRSRAHRPRDRGGPALRDAADHRAALRHRGHRAGRRARFPRAR